jgi:hypothetical protein
MNLKIMATMMILGVAVDEVVTRGHLISRRS